MAGVTGGDMIGVGDTVKVVGPGAVEDQDWWDVLLDSDLAAEKIIPIIKSSGRGTVVDWDGDYFKVAFDVVIPFNIELYFTEEEMEKTE